MTATTLASMGGPLSEAEREHGIDIDWAYEAIRCKCDAAFVENDIEALSLHLQDVARAEATARVGALEGQLATAREELATRDASIVALSERSTAKGLELDRVIREAAADKAKLAAVQDLITPKIPDWKPLSERYPEHFTPDTPEESARKKGWGQGEEMLTRMIRYALDGPTAAPEMPRPPAEEAQERPETVGTGSGRGTGVTETPGTAREEWQVRITAPDGTGIVQPADDFASVHAAASKWRADLAESEVPYCVEPERRTVGPWEPTEEPSDG